MTWSLATLGADTPTRTEAEVIAHRARLADPGERAAVYRRVLDAVVAMSPAIPRQTLEAWSVGQAIRGLAVALGDDVPTLPAAGEAMPDDARADFYFEEAYTLWDLWGEFTAPHSAERAAVWKAVRGLRTAETGARSNLPEPAGVTAARDYARQRMGVRPRGRSL